MLFSEKSASLKAQFLVLMDEVGSVAEVARRLGLNRNTAHAWARAAGLSSQRLGHHRKADYLQLREQGITQREAAARVSVNVRTGRDWDRGIRRSRDSRFYPDGRRVNYATGTTTMESMTSMPSPIFLSVPDVVDSRLLSLIEREKIADLLREGLSLRAIGRELARSASTIKRELDAHRIEGRYLPYGAHRESALARARPKSVLLVHPGPLREYVIEGLGRKWSPEQIRNRIREDHPDREDMRVSTETIYQAIYVQARGGLKREIQEALRTGRTRRKPHRSPQHRTSRFTDPMIMISDRPAEVEDRAVPGHWEGDLITGTLNQSAIITLVERTTRYVMLGHLPDDHSAEAVRDVLVELIGTLPGHLRGSLTWDQGAEMAGHKAFKIATGVPVYFCDPASPWQRGSNENTNGLLRQYFPKGTDLTIHGPADLEHVAEQLNSRPRKTLGWKTPAERLLELV